MTREIEAGVIPEQRVPAHPGRVLLDEYMHPLGLSQAQFARHLDVLRSRLADLIHGRRAVDADLAWRLSQAFGTTPQFWMNLQAQHDLALARNRSNVAPVTVAG